MNPYSKSESLANARRRLLRTESPMAAAARKVLRKRPEGARETWADRVMQSLLKIGTEERKAIVALQAIRMILQQSGSPASANANAGVQDVRQDNPEIRSMSEEEIDARIAELVKTLGSVPDVASDRGSS